MPGTAARSPLIDAVRGVAILLVILFHYGLLTNALVLLEAPAPLRWVASGGWHGVTLFFVLSAFLLGGRALLALDETWTTGRAGAVLRWCGTRCYALYLVHQPVLALVFLAAGLRSYVLDTPSHAIWVALALVVTVVLAEILHRTVEQPCIAWGKRLASRTARDPVRPLPAAPA